MSQVDIVGKNILIIGAYSGYEASLFIEAQARRITGVDIFVADNMYRHKKYKFVESAAENLPFKSSQFDLVYSQAVLEHVVDIQQTWRECVRVTKTGGFIAHIASPLWLTRDGHHRPDLFGFSPWCHIGRKEYQWKAWALEQRAYYDRLPEIMEAITYCSNVLNTNQQQPRKYSESVDKLQNVKIIQNIFELDPTPISEIPLEVLKRFPKDIFVEDLLKFTHIGIVQKIKCDELSN